MWKSVAERKVATWPASAGKVRPATMAPRRMVAGGATYSIAMRERAPSKWYTRGACAGARRCCRRSASASMRQRSRLSGQDSPTQRT